MAIYKRLTSSILKEIVDLLGVDNTGSREEILFAALDHASLWIEIFQAAGKQKHLDLLREHKSCMKLSDTIRYFQNIITEKKICFSLIQRLKPKEKDMLKLLSCKQFNITVHSIEENWRSCCTEVNDLCNALNVIRHVFLILNDHFNIANAKSTITWTLDFIKDRQNLLEMDKILVIDINKDKELATHIQESAIYCGVLETPIKSKVFWNILSLDVTKRSIDTTAMTTVDELALQQLSGEKMAYNVFQMSLTLTFIRVLSDEFIAKYKQIWEPFLALTLTSIPLSDFKMMFSNIKTTEDMEKEIQLMEEVVQRRCSADMKYTLIEAINWKKYSKIIDTMKISLLVFQPNENVDTFVSIVKDFNNIFISEELDGMYMDDLSLLLSKIKSVGDVISSEVKDILNVLNKSPDLLTFLQEVIDEDIRNLIDAVEEHSEQYVRESTVSDLIEVKSFFYPILKAGDWNQMNLFEKINSQLQSGFKNMSVKVTGCIDNLHTLRALYTNVANRGERTKEIINNILTQGKFYFCMEKHNCDITVTYTQKTIITSHTGVDLNDLRSRVLLLLNAEEGYEYRQKNIGKKEMDEFLDLVNTAFSISFMCRQLKQQGHFNFSRFEHSYDRSALSRCNQELKKQEKEWQENISSCRDKYFVMNFIRPAQLQQIYEYLYNHKDNEVVVLTILQFISRHFDNIRTFKKLFMSLPVASNNKIRLQNIALSLQFVFKDFFNEYFPVDGDLPPRTKQPTITDIVQHGIPYIAALEQESPLVIRTLFALYINSTNRLPKAHQVLFCMEETTLDDIDLFVRRCVGDLRSEQLYCITNIEMLSAFVLNQFIEKVLNLPRGNYLLSMICRGTAYHPFLDTFADRTNRPTPVSVDFLKKCFSENWPKVNVVSSSVPGLGKTEMIHRHAREKRKCVSTLHISGNPNIESIIQKLNFMKIKKYHVLHIDIGATCLPSYLDSVLFQLIVLGYLSTGAISYNLPTDDIAIEISNTVQQSLCNSLPTITCFTRQNIEWDDYTDMTVSEDINSPVQVVCNYLKALENRTIDRTDIYFTGPTEVQTLKHDECVYLLRKHFSTVGNMSYTLLQIFLNVLSDQLKKLSSSVFFRTATIAAMVGKADRENIKKNLVEALLHTSKEFASRSIESCRTSQVNSLSIDADNNSKHNYSEEEELAERVKGMIRWTDSNHLVVLFHQNAHTVTAFYRDKNKIPKAVQTLFKTQIRKNLEDFGSKTQEDLQSILQLITRSKEKLPTEYLKEKAIRYALTPDNLLKMILLSLRINSNIPVVIMGETGCGKTSLIRYLADICGVNFNVLSIHAGTEEIVIEQKVRKCNSMAMANLDKDYWLFLDEINTCEHIGVLNSIICHRYIHGETFCPNLKILAACNPYRLRPTCLLTSGLQGKVKTDKLSRLVYRVHPLPEALIDFVWDYGTLSKEDEEIYISKMVKGVFPDHLETLLTKLLAMSQNFIRKLEGTECCVSLRDVDRSKKLVLWFQQFFRMKNTESSGKYVIEIKAIVLALSITYHSRIKKIKTRLNYCTKVAQTISDCGQGDYDARNVLQIIESEQKDMLDRMKPSSGIAKNMALRENVFVALICILTKIPIFLVGKPGSSKSLAIQLIRSKLRGKDSKDQLFQKLPQLFCVSFQGSESSTSDGILKVFEKAENYQKHNGKGVISVVILDEIGLAEHSRFNPLKVLHGLLEPVNSDPLNVAVVGISNWALDAAKMNRAVHLSRPDMDLEELKSTGYSIRSAMRHDQEESNVNTNNLDIICKFDNIAEAYFKYISERRPKFEDFHGLRDYYSLVKCISRCSDVFSNETEQILIGIERNFGGLPSKIVGIKKIFEDFFPDLKHRQVPITNLIKDNLNDHSCRHLMLITKGDSVITVLESHLSQTCRPFEIIFGSRFDDDLSDDYNYRTLSRIILCMEQGIVLILKDLEAIYGSLYDMLNQNYTVVGNKKNCRIALGHYSNPMCHVHDSFKCIVIMDESKLDYSDPPFLNRFEKQLFRFDDLIEHEIKKIITDIDEVMKKLCHIKGYHFDPEDTIPSYSHDLIVSLILRLEKNSMSLETYKDNAIQLLLWIIPPDIIVRAKDSDLHKEDQGRIDGMMNLYMQLPVHKGLTHLLNAILDSPTDIYNNKIEIENTSSGKLLLLYTFANIHVDIKSCLNKSHQLEKLSSFKSEKLLSIKIEEFYRSEKTIFLLQCSATNDSQHVLLSKIMIENIRRKECTQQKHVCMIIHLDRRFMHKHEYVPINYLSEWQIIFLDTLQKPLNTVSDFMVSTEYDIVDSRRPLDTYIVQNLFWAFTRIKFATQNNPVEIQKKLMTQLQTSKVAISTLEELIVRWIKNQANEETEHWCIRVAKNIHDLCNAGTLLDACETNIHNIIKTPLAMFLFKLLELQIISQLFIEDDRSLQRIDIWKKVVLSTMHINIRDVPPLTGPECYACSEPFLSLKMPLSRVFMLQIESRKDDFLNIMRKLRIHTCMEREQPIEDCLEGDEDIPNDMFVKAVTECIDIICCGVDEVNAVEYNKRVDDYIHDFCSVFARTVFSISDDNISRKMFKWSIYNFINSLDFDQNNIVQVMASLHAAFWLNSGVIFSICQLVEISVLGDCLDVDILPKEIICKDNKQTYPNRQRIVDFVDTICLNRLPTQAILDKFLSASAWVIYIQRIIPVAKCVSYETIAAPALEICCAFINMISDDVHYSLHSAVLIADLLKENDGNISCPPVFDLITDTLHKFYQRMIIHKLKLQKFYCYYVYKCIEVYPDDTYILERVLNFIHVGKVLDERMNYLGKCLDFIVMLEGIQNENFITEIILNNKEMPAFIECINSFLKTVDIENKSLTTFTCLLIDSIQNSCLHHLNMDNLLQIGSESHSSVICLSEAFDIVVEANISFKYVAAVAYLRKFIETFLVALEEFNYDASKLSTVKTNVNNILSIRMNENNFSGVNKLLLYFLKLISKRHGIEQAYKLRFLVQKELPCLEYVDWREKCIQYSPVFNPVVMHIDKNLHDAYNERLDIVVRKDHSLEELVSDGESSVMTFLGFLSQRFYMRTWLKELSDNELGMTKEIEEIVKKSNLPSKCKHIAGYLLGKEFGHDFFAISEATKSPTPEIISVLLHLCCMITTSATSTSIWYAKFYHPKISTAKFFPCGNIPKPSQAEQKLLRMLNAGILLCSIGFELTTEDELRSFDDSFTEDYFRTELFVQYKELQNMLQLNSSNLCIVLHCVIKTCEVLITHESDYTNLTTEQQKIDIQTQYIDKIKEIFENRWQIILNFKQKQSSFDGTLNCIESLIDELVIPPCEDANTKFAYHMFRTTTLSTKDIFLDELHLGCKHEFVFLDLIRRNEKKIYLPKFIPALVRWHMSVTTYESYKFCKVEFSEMTVQNLLDKERDDVKRQLLVKHFEEFSQAWNEILDQYENFVEGIVMTDMSQKAKMETCTILKENSILFSLIRQLVNINNSFLDHTTGHINHGTPNTMFDIGGRSVSLFDIKPRDVVNFDWKDCWLRHCQCETVYGLGQKLNFDFEMIEEEIKKDTIYGKAKIKLPLDFPKPIFVDDLFQNSVKLLSEIESTITQQGLTTEIKSSLELKSMNDASFVSNLLTYIGMVLTLLNKTGGDDNQSLLEYFDKFQSITNMNSSFLKQMLPEPFDSVKLCHVVTLYKWLEELNGETLIKNLDRRYHKPLPPEAENKLKDMAKNKMEYLRKFVHPLLVFVHRNLSTNQTKIRIDNPLVDYISDPVLWWNNDVDTNGAYVLIDTEKIGVSISDVIGPLVLVGNVFETVSFIQNAIKESKEYDNRVKAIGRKMETPTRTKTSRRDIVRKMNR